MKSILQYICYIYTTQLKKVPSTNLPKPYTHIQGEQIISLSCCVRQLVTAPGEVNVNATSDFTGSVSRASGNSLHIFYSVSTQVYRLRTSPDTYCRAVTSSAAYFSVHFLILLQYQLPAMIFLEVYKVSDVCNAWCQTICFSM